MKNFNLIEWLQTDSHEKQSATRVHHGTKSRELAGNPRPLRYPCATLALPLRYVAMIFAVLVMSIANIGMAWGASVSEGTYNFVDQTIGAVTKFYKIDNGIYQYRLNAYTKNSSVGIQLPGSGDGTGFVFHLESTQKVYIGLCKKSVKSEVVNNLYIEAITEANFSAIEAGSNNYTAVTLSLAGSATLSKNYTFSAIDKAKTEGATVYMGELPAGYYYAYGNSTSGNGNLYSISFGTQTLFLVPNDKTSDNAKFAIYYWMGASGYERQGWSDYMTVSPCNSSTYRADIPKGYTKVIFVRLDPNGGRNWNSKWNQTGNLTFDGSKDLFTWANGDWDDVTTTWSASTKYTISFAANGGTGSMSNVSSIACGRSVTLAANAYEKSGYVFAGWKTNVAVTANGSPVAADGIVDDEATISNITSNITLTAQWNADAAPSSAVISGTYHYFPGENISLTVTPSGNNGPTTYQWYKGGKADGNRIDGATSATYTKNSCTFDDAGSYYCKVTCNATSIWAVTNSHENYDVKILRLYVKGSKNGEDYGNVDFVKVDGTTATASISLGSNWTYGFNIADGCGHYYGNAGTMQENNCTGWTTNVNGTDCGLTTTNAATYIFTINYSSLEAITTSVTYPTANQAADKVIYFDNQTVDWSTLHYRIGKSNHTQATAMTKVSGTNNLYKVTTAEYNGFSGWHISNNSGWTGSNSIYRTYTDGDKYSISYATAHEGGAVTDAAVTVTPTTWKDKGGDAGINDNCDFYNYSLTTGMKTDNVTISPYSNGTITVNYTNTSGSAATLTSGNADLAHSVILTSITAVADEGYDASAITINGDAYEANYVVTGNTTIAASFTPHVYSIALNKGDHGAANQSASVAYLADALTSITHVAANTGYNRLGYYDGATKVLNADGSFAASTVSGYITDGVWTKTSDAALTAKWEAQTYTISYKDKGNKTYSGSNLASLPTSHTYGSSTALVDGVKSGYTFVGWYTDEDCTVSAGSSIGATAKTANFTLYAKWTYSCPADNSGETIYKFVPVTSLSDKIADATDFTTENYLSELTGGTLVSHCSASGNVKMNSNGVQLASSTGYLELNFECALQTGDKVKWKCYSAAVRLCNSTTYDSSKDLVLAKSQDSYSELYITSSMEGKKKLYLKHSGSNSTVMTFELYRAGGYNVTYKANGSGESDVAHVTATVEDNMFTRNGYTFTGWNTDDEGEGDAYSADDDVTEDLTLYAQWTCTTPTFGTNLSTTPHEVEQGDAAVTLTVAATANSGTVTYQWYSNTSKSTVGATTLTTGASYNAPTSSVGTLYYYCVATNSTSGCSTTAQSNYATVTVTEAPCFKFTCESQSSSVSAISSGSAITTSSWEDGKATLTGGTMTNSGSASLGVNKTYGIVLDGSTKEVTVTLGGDNTLAVGSVITLKAGVSDADGSQTSGLVVSGNTCSPASYTSSTAGDAFTQTYTVTALDGLAGTKSFTIAKKSDLTKTYLNGITVTGCDECEGITPNLSYSKTTLWVNDGDTSTPTLDKDESTGSVTYSSSNTDVATVNESTGVVAAVAGGNVTITASIAADGTHCANTATCNLTIKQATCGEVVIAGVTLSAKDAGTPEGTLIASSSGYVVSTQKWEEPKGGCGTGGKLGESGNYICLTLKSGESFKNGDKVILDIANVSDVGDKKLHIYAGTSSAGTQLGVNASPVCGENEITLSGISTSTPSITLYRTSGDDKQNPYVVSMKVKRFICTDCFGFVDATENGNWNTAGNWIGSTGVSASVPTISDRVHIYKPVTVDINNAKASSVYIYTNSTNTGKVTIDAGKALIIAGKLAKSTNGTSYTTTAAADVIINSTRAAGTGALVIGRENGSNQATVNFQTKVKRDDGAWINQFIGSPFSDLEPYVDYALQIYAFKADGSGNRGYWDKLSSGSEMVEFVGHNILYNDNNYLDVSWTGTLNASSDKELTGYYGANTYNLFANSWIAPIHIGSFESTDFANMDATIYIFNAGTPQQEQAMSSDVNANTAAGTYATIPISSAEWISGTLEVIPAMQAFFVNANAASPSLTLDYSKLVYTPALTSVGITPTRAPKRATASESPEVIRLRVTGENGWAETTYLLGREDFTEGFDNGWDGRYMEGEDTNPQLYAPTSDGNMAVNCVPQIEGTLLGFRKGNADSQYTFTFEYAGDEDYYLKDLKLDIETPIDGEHSYAFTAEAGDNVARFIIVRKTPTITTGTADVESDVSGARKVIYNNKVYIIRGGSIYSVDGQVIK